MALQRGARADDRVKRGGSRPGRGTRGTRGTERIPERSASAEFVPLVPLVPDFWNVPITFHPRAISCLPD